MVVEGGVRRGRTPDHRGGAAEQGKGEQKKGDGINNDTTEASCKETRSSSDKWQFDKATTQESRCPGLGLSASMRFSSCEGVRVGRVTFS